MRHAGHGAVACMGEAYWVLVEKHEGQKHLEDLSIDGRIILIWTLKI
jgi:hypothetical protein